MKFVIKQHIGYLAWAAILLPVPIATAEEAQLIVPSSVIQQINPPEALRSGAIVLDPKLQQAVYQKMVELMEETMIEVLSEMGMEQGKQQQVIADQIRNNLLQNRFHILTEQAEIDQNEEDVENK